MIVPLLVYTTHILTIEISTLISGFFYELSRAVVEYIIYPTTESVTP